VVPVVPGGAQAAGGLLGARTRRAAADGLGRDDRQIARRLHLAPDTVKQHTSSGYRKLQARNRAAVVNRAQQIGLVG